MDNCGSDPDDAGAVATTTIAIALLDIPSTATSLFCCGTLVPHLIFLFLY